jgi:O-antigen biosynthesis protein
VLASILMAAPSDSVSSVKNLYSTALPACTAAICTRHRTVQLRRALASLGAQSEAPLEVLVIDNAPDSDETQRVVECEFPSVRCVREPRQGLDFARNRALTEARGEIVAFLDDDAVAGFRRL